MTGWETLPGETPIDPSGLTNRGAIANRQQLAEAEARNIRKAILKYLAATPSPRIARFDYEWFLQLHREMYEDVWTWAGSVRSHDLNLGVPHYQVIERLAALVEALASWTGYGHAISTQAVWLHHKAVQIHPFQNGNGRWARLLANVWLKRHGEPVVVWPDELLGTTSAVRDEYLEAIKAAGGGDYAGLEALHRSFQVEA